LIWNTRPADSDRVVLTEAIDAKSGALRVNAAVPFSKPPFVIIVDSEEMQVRGVSGGSWNVARAWEGTAAAAHRAGAHVIEATSDALVCFGTGPLYGSSNEYSRADLPQGGFHFTYASGLRPSTTYHYKVCSTPYSVGKSACGNPKPATVCSEDRTFTTAAAPDIEPERPRREVDIRLPVQNGHTLEVAANCSDLQTKLNAAQPGDTVTIPAETVCEGNYWLPKKDREGWIIVRTAAKDGEFPAFGTRVKPEDAPLMPKILSPSSNSPIRVADGASHYRLIGLEVSIDLARYAGPIWDLVNLEAPSVDEKQDRRAMAHDIIVDRCYIHGEKHYTVYRGVRLSCNACAVVNSHISDIQDTVADVNAIGMANADGPIRIENNYLESSAINVFGGDAATVPGIVVSDVVVRNNRITKDLKWRYGDPNEATLAIASVTSANPAVVSTPIAHGFYPGGEWIAITGAQGEWSVLNGRWYAEPTGPSSFKLRGDRYLDASKLGPFHEPAARIHLPYIVKNLLEIKSGRRWLIEGNVLDTVWAQAQAGCAVLITPRGPATWAAGWPGNLEKCGQCNRTVQDVTFINNWVDHAAAGVSLIGFDSYSINEQAKRIKFANNLFSDLSRRWTVPGATYGTCIAMSDGFEGVIWDHNTCLNGGAAYRVYGAAASYAVITNSIGFFNGLGLWTPAGLGSKGLAVVAPVGSRFTNNVMIGGPAMQPDPWETRKNQFPAEDLEKNLWIDSPEFMKFRNAAADDYSATEVSPFRGKALDHTDIGADLAKIPAWNDAGLRKALHEVKTVGPPEEPAPATSKTAPAASSGSAPKGRSTPAEVATRALVAVVNGDLKTAIAAFTPAAFPQERQGDEVRRAYIEVQMQNLRYRAAERDCAAALRGVDTIGDEDKRLPFTLYGFEEYIKSARFQYFLGAVESMCGDPKAARRRWSKVAKLDPDALSADFAFPALALESINEAEGKARAEADAVTIARLLKTASPDSRGLLYYSQGILLLGLGREQDAAETFQAGANAPDRGSSKYLNSLALAEAERAGIRLK
jgi:hypothetical protein